MAGKLIQGQGASTEFKQRGLGSVFAVNLRIFQSRFGKDDWGRYMHFDLNAGTGYNDLAGCIGSPLAFLNAAQDMGVSRFNAFFVDREGDSLKQLMTRPELQRKECQCHHGFNESFMDAIPDLIQQCGERPKWALGTILSDPNGADVPFEKLGLLNAQCPRLDFVVNWNSTIFKRLMASSKHEGRGRLSDALRVMGKKHWIISPPKGRQQFTLLVGRNFPVSDHKAIGLADLDSPQGRYWFDLLNHTQAEREQRFQDNQGVIFDLP